MAAITDEPENDKLLTEADWNTKSTLDRNLYYLSKTLAERAAWDFGPSLTAELNTTNQIFADMLKGTFPGMSAMSPSPTFEPWKASLQRDSM